MDMQIAQTEEMSTNHVPEGQPPRMVQSTWAPLLLRPAAAVDGTCPCVAQLSQPRGQPH